MSNYRIRNHLARATMALALVSTAVTSTPALARPDWGGGYNDYRRPHGDRGAGAAIATGILGIVLGAAIASGNNRAAPPPQRYYDVRPDVLDGCYAPYSGAGFCYPAERYLQQGWRPYRSGWMDPSGRVFNAPFDLSYDTRR